MRLTVVSTGCGQVGQINFLDGIDRSEEKERWYREKAATYKEWLTLPEKTFIRGGNSIKGESGVHIAKRARRVIPVCTSRM